MPWQKQSGTAPCSPKAISARSSKAITTFPPMRSRVSTLNRAPPTRPARGKGRRATIDRKSTRLNSSHGYISYAVFCLKKKKHHDEIILNCVLPNSPHSHLSHRPTVLLNPDETHPEEMSTNPSRTQLAISCTVMLRFRV